VLFIPLLSFALLRQLFTRVTLRKQTTEQYREDGASACSDVWQWEEALKTRSKQGERNLFSFWTTSRTTWRGRHWLVLESIFVHNPGISINLLVSSDHSRADTITSDMFSPFRLRGYKVTVVQFDPVLALECGYYGGDKSRQWLSQHRKWRLGRFFYSHWSDYLRFVLLDRFGGVYTDLDAISVKSFPSYENFIAADDPGSSSCDWCFTENGTQYYLAPGVMASQRGRFRDMIETVFTEENYNPDCFNCVGPKAMIHLDSSVLSKFEVLRSETFYPLMYTNAHLLFQNVQNRDRITASLQLPPHAISIHLFGHTTGIKRVKRRSIINLLMTQYALGLDSAKRVTCGRFRYCHYDERSGASLRILGPIIFQRTTQHVFSGLSAAIFSSVKEYRFDSVEVSIELDECSLFVAQHESRPVQRMNFQGRGVDVAGVNELLYGIKYDAKNKFNSCAARGSFMRIDLVLKVASQVTRLQVQIPYFIPELQTTIFFPVRESGPRACQQVQTYKRDLQSIFPLIELAVIYDSLIIPECFSELRMAVVPRTRLLRHTLAQHRVLTSYALLVRDVQSLVKSPHLLTELITARYHLQVAVTGVVTRSGFQRNWQLFAGCVRKQPDLQLLHLPSFRMRSYWSSVCSNIHI